MLFAEKGFTLLAKISMKPERFIYTTDEKPEIGSKHGIGIVLAVSERGVDVCRTASFDILPSGMSKACTDCQENSSCPIPAKFIEAQKV